MDFIEGHLTFKDTDIDDIFSPFIETFGYVKQWKEYPTRKEAYWEKWYGEEDDRDEIMFLAPEMKIEPGFNCCNIKKWYVSRLAFITSQEPFSCFYSEEYNAKADTEEIELFINTIRQASESVNKALKICSTKLDKEVKYLDKVAAKIFANDKLNLSLRYQVIATIDGETVSEIFTERWEVFPAGDEPFNKDIRLLAGSNTEKDIDYLKSSHFIINRVFEDSHGNTYTIDTLFEQSY